MFPEKVELEKECDNCKNKSYLKETIVKVDQNLIRIGIVKGKVYEKLSCEKCGKLIFEVKEVDYTKRPKD